MGHIPDVEQTDHRGMGHVPHRESPQKRALDGEEDQLYTTGSAPRFTVKVVGVPRGGQ